MGAEDRGPYPDDLVIELTGLLYEVSGDLSHWLAFMDRLRQSAVKDASLNAVVRLDILASIILLNLDQDTLDDIEAMFSAYLPGDLPEEGDSPA